MILPIYLTLLTISLIFIFLGYMLGNDAEIFKLVGFTFLFLLGIMIIPNTAGSLEYVTGSTVLETATGYTITDTTATYEDIFIGFSLCVASVCGFVNTFFSMRRTD